LLERQRQQRLFCGGDREQITSARQAAEALFKPKPDVGEPPASDPAQSAGLRKPRVLPVLPTAAIRHETVNASATSEQPRAPQIPARKSARLRTLLKYGMTVSQLADLYRVPVETIERIRKPDANGRHVRPCARRQRDTTRLNEPHRRSSRI